MNNNNNNNNNNNSNNNNKGIVKETEEVYTPIPKMTVRNLYHEFCIMFLKGKYKTTFNVRRSKHFVTSCIQ